MFFLPAPNRYAFGCPWAPRYLFIYLFTIRDWLQKQSKQKLGKKIHSEQLLKRSFKELKK